MDVRQQKAGTKIWKTYIDLWNNSGRRQTLSIIRKIMWIATLRAHLQLQRKKIRTKRKWFHLIKRQDYQQLKSILTFKKKVRLWSRLKIAWKEERKICPCCKLHPKIGQNTLQIQQMTLKHRQWKWNYRICTIEGALRVERTVEVHLIEHNAPQCGRPSIINQDILEGHPTSIQS